MKKNKLFYLLLFLVIIILSSCEKIDNKDCSNNCKEVNVNGYVFDETTNLPIANKIVNIRWSRKPFWCFNCYPDDYSFNTSTDNIGRFDTNIKIDSTTYGYSLYISALGTIADREAFMENGINANFQNNAIGLIPLTDLKIKLHRSLNDLFASYELKIFSRTNSNGIGIAPGFSHYFYGNQPIPLDTIIQGKVAGNLFTKIKTTKRFSTLPDINSIDSIICLPNTTTVYNINF